MVAATCQQGVWKAEFQGKLGPRDLLHLECPFKFYVTSERVGPRSLQGKQGYVASAVVGRKAYLYCSATVERL